MRAADRIEQALENAISIAEGRGEGLGSEFGAPPLLVAAMRHAVFPGGHRIRPQLCLAVAQACGDADPVASNAAAVSIELLHCASLVHDDLPCFDNAATRRGQASVHAEFGEPLAVLTGDALIVLAFETLAVSSAPARRLLPMLATIARSVGSPNGIVAGQAWESEPAVPLADYQRAKTGALFVAATIAGAAAAGFKTEPWRALGATLGEAYQVADDLRDILCDADELGKPVGQDAARLRPNAALQLGLDGARRRLEGLVQAAVDSIPGCPGVVELREQIKAQTEQFFPKQLSRAAA
jgi:geranylgeranyl diphosphate synthase type II